MAKSLNIKLGDKTFSLAPTKVERKKLYGWTETRAVEPDGKVCRQAGLDSDGVTVIPSGAIKNGMIRADGLWMEKDELKAVHADGTDAEPFLSSFDEVIELGEKATLEALLDLIISSVYQLDGEEDGALATLVGTDIYRTTFSYRGGYEQSDAFVVSNGSATFILVGEKSEFEFVGLDNQGVIEELEEECTMEEDELDFSNM